MSIARFIALSDPLVLWPSAAVALLLWTALLGRLSGSRSAKGPGLLGPLGVLRHAALILLTLGAVRALGASLSQLAASPAVDQESWLGAAEAALLAGRGSLVLLPPLLFSLAVAEEPR